MSKGVLEPGLDRLELDWLNVLLAFPVPVVCTLVALPVLTLALGTVSRVEGTGGLFEMVVVVVVLLLFEEAVDGLIEVNWTSSALQTGLWRTKLILLEKSLVAIHKKSLGSMVTMWCLSRYF